MQFWKPEVTPYFIIAKSKQDALLGGDIDMAVSQRKREAEILVQMGKDQKKQKEKQKKILNWRLLKRKFLLHKDY